MSPGSSHGVKTGLRPAARRFVFALKVNIKIHHSVSRTVGHLRLLAGVVNAVGRKNVFHRRLCSHSDPEGGKGRDCIIVRYNSVIMYNSI